MKWTLDWLRDYLETDAAAEQIASKLTQIGLEVESVETPAVPVAAKIVECSDIPDTHLHLLSVDDGRGVRQVVCGAPNVRAGLVSALARPGCIIEGNEIKVGKIRGQESNGMMCSERELGLGADHNGIVELDAAKYEIGEPLGAVSADAVFDAGITPNRPDYLAVRGIARDLAAAGLGKMKWKFDNYDFGALKPDGRGAKIENYAACPAYGMCEIRGIKIAPSNPLIASRLAAIGINPRNAPVDATNYVCYDIGQPMHCFDADKVRGDLIIRNAKEGEEFTDLFDRTHILTADDLVISDADGVLALASVMGGKRSMTTDSTKNIILEAAYFDPVFVRKTSRRLGLQSDSSYRFERGVDPTIAMQGISAAAKLIIDACGGDADSPFFDYDRKNPALSFMAEPSPREYGRAEYAFLMDPRRIEYSPGLFKKKTGIDLPGERQRGILEGLGFGVEADGDIWTIAPPPARADVQIPENIVSELIRIYGYENVRQEYKEVKPCGLRIPAVKELLASRGLSECMSYEFGNAFKEKLLSDRPNIKIKNPIIDTFDTARNTLVQGMLDVIANNDRFRRSNLALFEIGPVFDGPEPDRQHDQLIIARTGIFGDKIGIKHGRTASIYDIRADLLALFPGAAVENETAPEPWEHPFRAGRIVQGGVVVARFAELMPALAKKFGIKTNVAIGLVIDAALGMSDKEYELSSQKRAIGASLAEFPLITRDFAFAVDAETDPASVAAAAATADGRITETNVFDVFDMPDGKKSVAFEIVIQPESNLNDGDLLEVQGRVIASVEKLGAKIRDK